MYTHRSRGFTLIELLVVISIIGVLSAVVLASLNSARVKGNNAAIQSNLSTIQTQAEVYYGNTNNTYGITVSTGNCALAGSMFVVDNNIKKALVAAQSANGNNALTCYATASLYAVSSIQAGGVAGKYWCIDSLGNTGQTLSAATAAGCP